MPTGIGAVGGAFMIARYGERGKRGRWLSIAILAFPLVLTIFSVISAYRLALAIAVGLGVGFYDDVYADQYAAADACCRRNAGASFDSLHVDVFWLCTLWQLDVGSLAETNGISRDWC